MTGWLIFALVAVFLAGSILFVLPSPGERHRMALRQHAMQQGFAITMQKLEIPSQESRLIAVYTLRQPRSRNRDEQPPCWQLQRSESAFLDPFCPGWSWARQPERVPQGLPHRLSDLPPGVLALARSQDGLQFFWTEQDADPGTVDQLLHLGRALLGQEAG